MQFQFGEPLGEPCSCAFGIPSRRYDGCDFMAPLQCHEDYLSADLVGGYKDRAINFVRVDMRKETHTTSDEDPRHLPLCSSPSSDTVVNGGVQELGFIRW